MKKVPVITLEYQSFVIDEATARIISSAIINGEFRKASKNYIDGAYKVVVESIPTFNLEVLEEIPDNKAEIEKLETEAARLEARIKELRGDLNG